MHQERVQGHHARVLQEILGHPTPRNLESITIRREIAARVSVKHADLSALTTAGSIEAVATSP